MTPEQKDIVLAHTQHVARHYVALKVASIDKIIQLVRHSIGPEAPDADRISNFLRRESTLKELEYRHESALFQTADIAKSWNLVCLAAQTDPEKARYLLARRPPSARHCSFCWLDEPRAANSNLIPEKDLFGNPVPAVNLHPQCLKAWRALRRVVELEGIKNDPL